VEAGFAQHVARSIPAPGSADVVVVLADATDDLNRAAAAVAPHGVLYVEVDRRSPKRLLRSPSRVSRQLRTLGLRIVGQYWVVPDFTRARRYLPLEGGAISWYVESSFRQFSGLRRSAAAVLRRWITGGPWARRLVPAYSLVAVGRSVTAGAPALLADMSAHTGRIGSDGPVALMTGGHDDGSRVVMLPFSGAGPPAVVKVSRVPAFNVHTTMEQAALREIHARLPAALRSMVPAPYGSRLWHGLAASVESFAGGRTLLSSSGRHGATPAEQRDDLRAATDWLIEFHRNMSANGRGWRSADVDRWLAVLFERYRQTCGGGSRLLGLFASTRAAACALGDARVPLVLQHNDFGPWNIHRSQALVVVVDWESTDRPDQREGPALLDLVYFVANWFFIATHAQDRRSRCRAFASLQRDRTSPHARAVHDALASYMEAFQIPPAFLPIAQVATWVRRALDREIRRRTGGPHVANLDRDLVSVLGAQTEHLFATSG
jgi:hypothetical protein